jgi:short subunit dehydrogenase-like uncharacterized protein
VKRALMAWVGRRVTGPDAAMRERARIYLWGEVRDAEGRTASSTRAGVTSGGQSTTVRRRLPHERRLWRA